MIKAFNIAFSILAILAICLSCDRTGTKQAAPKPHSEFEFSKDYYEWPVINSADTSHEFSFSSGYHNMPNPFGGSTVLMYSLPRPCSVSVEIFNVQGAKLGTLELGNNQAGRYKFQWRATRAPSGVYFLIFNACDFSDTAKFINLK